MYAHHETKDLYTKIGIVLYPKRYSMLKKVELRILEHLFDDLVSGSSILEISKKLKLPYPLTYNTVKSLVNNGIISSEKKGNASIIKINFKEVKKEHLYAELNRRDKILEKYYKIKSVFDKIQKINQIHFICILFGSYAKGTPKQDSDIDLLFVIPEEYDYGNFDNNIRTILSTHDVDINLTPEKGLFEMWNTVKKFNVGNELLEGHIVLQGVEGFLELRRRYEYG